MAAEVADLPLLPPLPLPRRPPGCSRLRPRPPRLLLPGVAAPLLPPAAGAAEAAEAGAAGAEPGAAGWPLTAAAAAAAVAVGEPLQEPQDPSGHHRPHGGGRHHGARDRRRQTRPPTMEIDLLLSSALSHSHCRLHKAVFVLGVVLPDSTLSPLSRPSPSSLPTRVLGTDTSQ